MRQNPGKHYGRSPYGERESKYTDILHVTLGLVVAPHTGSVNLNRKVLDGIEGGSSRSPYGERESKLMDDGTLFQGFESLPVWGA